MHAYGGKDEKKLIVLVKQVPDIERVKFDYETGRIDRSSASAVVNPFDLNALEAALQIKEKVGAWVTAVSMGPPQAESTLRDALARGADRAILLTDRRFAGADTLATSYTLASAIKKLKTFDLILCGEKTIDGDTGQVGAQVAEHLSIPHVAYVDEIREVSSNGIVVLSQIGKCYYTFALDFPGLITVTKDLNVPRLPKLKDKIQARKATIEVWDAEDLAEVASIAKFGLSGSPTKVIKVYTPSTEKRRGVILKGTPKEMAEKLADILEDLKALK